MKNSSGKDTKRTIVRTTSRRSDKTAKSSNGKTAKPFGDRRTESINKNPIKRSTPTNKNVFLELGHNDERAAGQVLKSYFFMALQEIIQKSEMTQAEIAELIGADQPIVSKIMQGRTDLFAIERVVNYVQKLGYNIHVSFEPCPPSVQVGRVILTAATK